MQPLNHLLDELNERIRNGEGTEVVSVLCDDLNRRRSSMSSEEWTADVVGLCQRHPIQASLLEDPYTARALKKPRGYAGDAVMLDYIYSGEAPSGTSATGRDIFRGTTGLPNGQSVVSRRNLLAQRVDETASARPGARVLSIACGHLREAGRSTAVAAGTLSEFVAFDQDVESLAVVETDYAHLGVRAIRGSVTDLIRRRTSFEGFDFVYAAGLFDYLTQAYSRRLLALMTQMVRPGGSLLVANFTPDNHGRGYMECFMDWLLNCRTENDMLSLLGEIDEDLVANNHVHQDELNNIVYLEIVRSNR